MKIIRGILVVLIGLCGFYAYSCVKNGISLADKPLLVIAGLVFVITYILSGAWKNKKNDG